MPDTFIDSYINHNKTFESPNSFWKWSAYAAIAAVLKDKCYLKRGNSLLFGNIYVLFLAESGGRKGPPIELAETLVNKVAFTKVISGRSSAQAILDELARTETDRKTGKVIKSSSAIFFGAEMAAGIVADKEGLGILTDIYDYKQNPFKNRLRTGPCFNLERIAFSMLSGSNEAMLAGVMTDKEIQGGFLARTFLITANETRPPNSMMRINYEELAKTYSHMLSKFTELSQLVGEFTLEEEAIDEYESWYNPFKLSYQGKKETTGVVARIHTGVVKLAMLIAANHMRLNICKCDIEQAIAECLALIPNYSIFTMKVNQKADLKSTGNILILHLLGQKNYIARAKDIIRDNWQQGLEPELLEKAAVMLEMAGMIQSISSNKDGLNYCLTKSCLEAMGRTEK